MSRWRRLQSDIICTSSTFFTHVNKQITDTQANADQTPKHYAESMTSELKKKTKHTQDSINSKCRQNYSIVKESRSVIA